jgi:hypothetical protein
MGLGDGQGLFGPEDGSFSLAAARTPLQNFLWLGHALRHRSWNRRCFGRWLIFAAAGHSPVTGEFGQHLRFGARRNTSFGHLPPIEWRRQAAERSSSSLTG